MFILMILVIIIFTLIGTWQFRPLLTELQNLDLDQTHPISTALERFYFMIGLSFGLGTLAFSCIFFVAGLIISHKIAGPLFNLKRHLKEIRESGEYKEVKFRKKDYFHDLQDEINEFISHIKK